MLLMKKQFFDAIRSGCKTTTLRFWRYRRVKAGSTHRIPGLGKVLIESVEETSLDGLTERDAVADGFENLNELRRQLRILYPVGGGDGRRLFKVKFRLLLSRGSVKSQGCARHRVCAR